MQTNQLFFLFLATALFSGCLQQECRDCEAFNFEAEQFNPDFADNDLVFRDTTGGEVTFEFLRMVNSPAQEVCSGNVSNPSDIPCVTNAITSFRNSDLGIDMLIDFEANDRFEPGAQGRVAMAFEFKGMESTRFTRTHALIVDPEIRLVPNAIVALDSVELGDTLLRDVIDLRQPAAGFSTVGLELPASGRFTNLYLRPNEGLLGLRDVEGKVYLRVR